MPPEISPQTKRCTMCQEVKELDEFHLDPSRSKGRDRHCKPCSTIRMRDRYQRSAETRAKRRANKERYFERVATEAGVSIGRAKTLRRKYKMSPQEFTDLLESQNGVCAICGTDEFWGDYVEHNIPCVDHCHETKMVRGLLCTFCNTMLGYARDKPEVLRKAAQYLEMAVSA